ncbi:MAG: hydroxyethylthiazole kinase [Proteobacteria bacterium]|nr:hydroxyethylthiazole kinase [Pseudomonadota bacterium]
MTLTTPGSHLDALRNTAPLVHCITNYVAMNISANVLLAAGASPAMVHATEEAGEFAAFAHALSINIGTISPAWVEGILAAVNGAKAAGKPWVLDPVAHFATGFRRETVAKLMALKPTVIRGNASEIIALAGGASAAQGVDARDSVSAAEAAARMLSRNADCVVAVTGETDFVTDGVRAVWISGGSALMPQVTALGCSLSSLVAGYVGLEGADPFDATVAACAHYAVAGEAAAREAAGPGSFQPLFLDALSLIDAATLDEQARILPA